MLSCGRVAGKWSRILSNAYTKNFTKSLRPFEFINKSCLAYSSDSKKSKIGSTATVEECVPKTKLSTKAPPLPPVSIAYPLQQSSQSLYSERSKSTSLHSQPLCEDKSYQCPPNCPPNLKQECYVPPDGTPPDPRFKYWKHLIAGSILAGISLYTYIELFSEESKSKKKKNFLPQLKINDEVKRMPQSSSAIPEEIPYLLIGAGTAAFSAFRSIKANDPTAKVLMITNEGDLPYMRPPLSKEIWYNKDEEAVSKFMFNQWNGARRSLYYEPPEFYINIADLEQSEKGGVAVVTGWNVKKIDACNRIAYLEDNYQIKYDKCLIATGASPKNLALFETMDDEKIKKRIIQYRTKADFVKLMHSVKNPDVKNIAIIGGGFLGSELSTSLVRNLSQDDKKIYQIFKEDYILSQILPTYLSKWATEHIKSDGVICMPNLEIHDCRMKNDQMTLTLTDGSTLNVDQIVVAIGVEPNTGIAEKSNLEVDPEQGGFLVNAELEARSNLWVAGDAACFYDVQLGRRRIEHHDNAVISGKLAGENMVGARKPYLHQSMMWSDLGQDVGFEAIGIIDSNLETFGVYIPQSPAKDDEPKENEEEEEEEEETASSEGIVESKKLSTIEANEEEDDMCDEKDMCDGVNVTETKNETADEDMCKEVCMTNTADDGLQKVDENYTKGIVFYLRNDVVVGIIMWNFFNRMAIARQVLARNTTKDELEEVIKLFNIYED